MNYWHVTGRAVAPSLGLCLGLTLGLTHAPAAHAGCAIEQTAANEIVIRTSVGRCDTSALRNGLAGAFAGSMSGPGAPPGAPANPLADVKRSSGQGALWRLANMHNQAGATSFSMPGGR